MSDIANSYRSIAYIGNSYRYISVNRGTYDGLDQDAHLPVGLRQRSAEACLMICILLA